MSARSPLVIIRLGSHAEKEYVIKLAPFFDGVIVGANLFEATPGATASLLLRASGRAQIFLDPMTYAYGAYIDPDTQQVRTDLDWIKSDQIRSKDKGKKKTVRDFKRSYRSLTETFGWPISDAITGSRAVSPDAFQDASQTRGFCERVVRYQLFRIAQEFQDEEELREFSDRVPGPAAVFAPYFYIEPTSTSAWLDANLVLAKAASGLAGSTPVHVVICADADHLLDATFVNRLVRDLPTAGVSGAWLWFSRFYEESASLDHLIAYRNLVARLSASIEVYALHGGFLSLALAKRGMRGVSHGVGYGEQKDVVPVIGQSTPTVRYYLPALARRLGVPEIERAFDALGIMTARDFHAKVCDCAMCKGVVDSSPRQFSAFGEMQRSRPAARRSAQTPAAAKRCRFHFLLSRIRERDDVGRMTVDDLIGRLKASLETWGQQRSLRESSGHLDRWATVLRQDS
jgi:hypothetical protein